jgi:hypothetical protein
MTVPMRTLALAVLTAALAGASPAGAKVGDLHALRYGAKLNLLVPYDPVRLVPSGPAIDLGHFAQSWSVSPDRSRFVAAAGRRSLQGGPSALQLVDLGRGRVEGTVELDGERRRVVATAWVRGRLLAVVSGSDATAVYAVDPDRRLVLGKVELPGAVAGGERSRDGIALLLEADGRIGPATLAFVDRTPRLRTAVLEQITIGTTAVGSGREARSTVRRPGLALAPSGARAYVFGAGEPAAVVDLRTMAVRYAPARFPAAISKNAGGSVRIAQALPDGRIVVAGYSFGLRGSTFLRVVDPEDWSSRLLDRTSPWFRLGGGMIFTHRAGMPGLRMWTPSGAYVDLFTTGSVGNVFVVGPRAFVTFYGKAAKAAVVELRTRRVVRHTVPAHPLVGAGQPIPG